MKPKKTLRVVLQTSAVAAVLALQGGTNLGDAFAQRSQAQTSVAQTSVATWRPAAGFSPSSLTKVAVIASDLSRSGSIEQATLRMVEDQFIEKLLEKGYQVAARSDVEQVLREIQFQQSGLTAADAAKVGRMLNVSAVIVVSINLAEVTSKDTLWITVGGTPLRNYYAKCNMSARLISVEKA